MKQFLKLLAGILSGIPADGAGTEGGDCGRRQSPAQGQVPRKGRDSGRDVPGRRRRRARHGPARALAVGAAAGLAAGR